MKTRLLELLACPSCGGELRVTASEADPSGGEEILSGRLDCVGCQATFPIRGGVPRLMPPTISGEQEKTATAFGWQWQEFTELYDEYEAQFLDWIHPIQPEFFRDKVVLDAGCGNGRHAYYSARYGARELVAMDLSAAVETAYANMGRLPNAHVIQADIYHPPFKRTDGNGGPFDFIYSIVWTREQWSRPRIHQSAAHRSDEPHAAVMAAGGGVADVSRLSGCGEGRLPSNAWDAGLQAPPAERLSLQPLFLQLSAQLQHRLRPPPGASRPLPESRRVRGLVSPG